MHKIRDIPVKTSDGKTIGKARVRVDEGGNVTAEMKLDSGLSRELMSSFETGLVNGLSIVPEVTLARQVFDFETTGLNYQMVNHGEVKIKQGPPPGQIGAEEIKNRFGFHKAAIEGPNAAAPLHAEARRNFEAFATWMDETLPGSREKSVAFTELENASMWAHKAIARLSWPR